MWNGQKRFQVYAQIWSSNKKRCHSASALSHCIERNISKIILTLSNNAKLFNVLKKTLTGGFSCVNTRLGFDTKTLFLNLTQSPYNKMNINQSFQSFKNKT